MLDERLDVGTRVHDGRPVGGQVGGVPACGVSVDQAAEVGDVGVHVAIGRRHDRGGPAHHVVAREQQIALHLGEAHVVGDVAGGVEALDAEPVADQHIAVAHDDVGDEVPISRLGLLTSVGCVRPVRRIRPVNRVVAGAGIDRMGPEPVGGSSRRRRQRGGRGRVVRVGVGDQDVRHRSTVERREQGVDVGGQVRAGVDDGHLGLAEHVGPCSPGGVLARVVRHHTDDAVGDRHRLAVPRVELGQERRGHHPTVRPMEISRDRLDDPTA